MPMAEEITEDWLKAHSSPASGILSELEAETAIKFPNASRMLTGFSQGRLLALFSHLLKPERILEIGTFTGYGSLCLAEGLSPTGTLITLENKEEQAEIASAFFHKSPYAKRIKIILGDALNSLEQIEETWDLVYIDANKSSNKMYLEKIWPALRRGGIAMVDNVFARGAVLKPESEQRGFEKSVTAFNKELPGLFPDAELIVLPIRDGLSILRKT
jgi:caffeoyl-CoA O-methyltransferase